MAGTSTPRSVILGEGAINEMAEGETSAGSKGMNLNTEYITPEFRAQGVELREPDDHVVELLKDGKLIARFSQTGVSIENILKEVEAGKYGN